MSVNDQVIDWMIEISFPEFQVPFLRHNVQPGSEALLVSYPLDTEVFPLGGVKKAGA
jgi:hypothetical protein